jgi:cellulose synthase/poly-beta-1,6-N-acetylglucosamine synthase-like glycosyltransferase
LGEIVFGFLAAFFLFLFFIPFAYSALIRVMARGSSPAGRDHKPSVSVIVPAHNEEARIGEKIQSLLSMEYARGRYEVIVVDDGSDDRTGEICRKFGKRIRYIRLGKPGGKIRALNAGIRESRNDIIVITDADTSIKPVSVRNLVRRFSEKGVAAVSGTVEIAGGGGFVQGMEREYVRQDNATRAAEGRTGSLVFLYGQLSAFRKDAVPEINPRAAVDDIEIALSVLGKGKKVVQEPSALVTETAPASLGEFVRQKKRRTLCTTEVVLRHMSLLNPARGWVSLSFLSHRVIPLLSPFLLALSIIFLYLSGPLLLAGLLLLVLIMSFVNPRIVFFFLAMQLIVLASWAEFLSGGAPSGASWRHGGQPRN